MLLWFTFPVDGSPITTIFNSSSINKLSPVIKDIFNKFVWFVFFDIAFIIILGSVG